MSSPRWLFVFFIGRLNNYLCTVQQYLLNSTVQVLYSTGGLENRDSKHGIAGKHVFFTTCSQLTSISRLFLASNNVMIDFDGGGGGAVNVKYVYFRHQMSPALCTLVNARLD